jgi:ABC-type sugar transport system substrate-binding protein
VAVLVATVAACGSTAPSSSTAAGSTAPSAATAAGSTAPSAAAGGDKLKIGVSFDKMDDAFRVGEKKYLDQYAAEMGIELVYQDAQRDAQKQSSQIQSFISQKVDGIIEIGLDTQAVAADIAAAKAANIPLALMDQQPADSSGVFFYVGGNPYSDGKMAGEYLVKVAAGKPVKVLELQGSLNNINGIDRSRGFEDAVAAASNIEIVAKAPTDWQADKALAATQNALQAHPDLGAVYSPWTGAMPGILTALSAVGKTSDVTAADHVFTMSINGDEIGCKYVTSGELGIDIATPVQDMAKMALQSIQDNAAGKAPAENVVLLPGVPYTPDDLAAMKDKIWGCAGS